MHRTLFSFLVLFVSLINLHAQDSTAFEKRDTISQYYEQNKGNELPSKSIGTVSNGSLVNGKLMPFSGVNFTYFDTLSYLSGRAFVHESVKKTILETYKELEGAQPGRHFYVMECSHREGGQLYPHHTHQNGLSVDFMMPLMKDGLPYYGFTSLGADHYWLEFDNDGHCLKDTSVQVDFAMVAEYIVRLHSAAAIYGMKISKVIIKLEFKDELMAQPYSRQITEKGIYVVKNLTPLINSLHDDHFHIDFAPLN